MLLSNTSEYLRYVDLGFLRCNTLVNRMPHCLLTGAWSRPQTPPWTSATPHPPLAYACLEDAFTSMYSSDAICASPAYPEAAGSAGSADSADSADAAGIAGELSYCSGKVRTLLTSLLMRCLMHPLPLPAGMQMRRCWRMYWSAGLAHRWSRAIRCTRCTAVRQHLLMDCLGLFICMKALVVVRGSSGHCLIWSTRTSVLLTGVLLPGWNAHARYRCSKHAVCGLGFVHAPASDPQLQYHCTVVPIPVMRMNGAAQRSSSL